MSRRRRRLETKPAPTTPVARTGARPAGTAGRAPPSAAGRGAPASPAQPPAEAERTRYRGVHWHRAPSGRIRWWNTEDRAWVLWHPGDDAPPRPEGWEPAGAPARSSASRPSFRSPYRLVPIVITLAIIGYGVIQATQGSGGQTAAEAKAATKLVGRCLVTNGTANGHPRYSAKPVACADPRASVRVVRVLAGTPGAPGCPPGTTPLALPYPGVRYPHVECVVPAR